MSGPLKVAASTVLAIAVALAIYLCYGHLFGRPLGELCGAASECSWSGLGDRVCLQQYWGYCTRPCATDRDCPTTMRCEPRHPQGSLCLLRPKPPAR
jgi:hypothetical protein